METETLTVVEVEVHHLCECAELFPVHVGQPCAYDATSLCNNCGRQVCEGCQALGECFTCVRKRES